MYYNEKEIATAEDMQLLFEKALSKATDNNSNLTD